MGPTWAFGQETAVHASAADGLSGLFDQYPKLQIILGHMGENLPFGLVADRQYATAGFETGTTTRRRKKSAHYFQQQFSSHDVRQLSTRPHCPYHDAWSARIASCFQLIGHSKTLIKAAQVVRRHIISENDRHKIGRDNADQAVQAAAALAQRIRKRSTAFLSQVMPLPGRDGTIA